MRRVSSIQNFGICIRLQKTYGMKMKLGSCTSHLFKTCLELLSTFSILSYTFNDNITM